MFGPNSALHVNNEAFLEQSLKTLRRERKKCLQLLALGVFLFVFTNVACVWYRWRGETGVVATMMTVVFSYYLKWMYANMMKNYQVACVGLELLLLCLIYSLETHPSGARLDS
jgi:hypothetical protein